MECRKGCGACCIAPSIPELDKPAGERCKHLSEDNECLVYDDRPEVCRRFVPSSVLCGDSAAEAMHLQTLVYRVAAANDGLIFDRMKGLTVRPARRVS